MKKPCVLETTVVNECNPVVEPECKEIEVGGFQEIILGFYSKIAGRNYILLPKLFWPTVRKNCFSDR